MLSKTEQVWRHVSTSALEHGRRRWPNLGALSSEVDVPLSTVHAALARPVEIGAVSIRGAGGVRIVDPVRVSLLWAGARRLRRDLLQQFSVGSSAADFERSLSRRGTILGGCGAAVTQLGGNTIADYDTVLVYRSSPLALPEAREHRSSRTTRVLVLQPDPNLATYGKVTPLVQAWVDLFNLPGWPAARFVHHLLLHFEKCEQLLPA